MQQFPSSSPSNSILKSASQAKAPRCSMSARSCADGRSDRLSSSNNSDGGPALLELIYNRRSPEEEEQGEEGEEEEES